MQTHIHPRSGKALEGVRLLPGNVIRENDMYDSSSGEWEAAGYAAGLTIQHGCAAIWVQPRSLSDNAG